MLIILTLITSCQRSDEKMSYVSHITHVEGIVAANDSIEALENLLAEYEAQCDDVGQMIVTRKLGEIHRESSNFMTALDYHEKALFLANELKDTANIINILNQLGTDLRRLGILDKAASRFYEALSFCEKYSNKNSAEIIIHKVISLNGIGNIQLSLHNNHAAEKIFREALSGEKSLGSHLGQAMHYVNIGYIKEANGEKDSAWIYYNYSMEQCRLANSKLGISVCYNHFGRLAEQNNEWDKALEAYKNAYDLMVGNKERWYWLESCLSMARVYLAMGQAENARCYINEGLKTATEIKSWEHLAEAYRLKSIFEEQRGDYKASLENFRKHSAFTDSIINKKNINHLDNLRVNYITEKGNKEKELVSQAYVNEQQKKKMILYFLIVAIFVSVIVISSLVYVLKFKAKVQQIIKETSQARQEFFTNVTHEFRTPLTVILGCAEVLKSKVKIKEYATEVDAISRQGQRILTLVNQLLDIAKVQSSIGNADWKNGNITAFIQMIVENIRPQAIKNLVEIEYHADKKEVYMDFVPDYIYKVITNILSNALKFTRKGGRITISSAVVNGNIQITVEDTGCGIKQEDLPHIFEPFFQANSGSGVGTGIGLALTKQMVEAMGGGIKVSSREGKGSSFVLSVPIRHGEKELEKWIPDFVAKTTNNETAIIEENNKYVYHDDTNSKDTDIALVVEDNEDIAGYIGNIIHQENFSVVYARNGREGIVKAEEYVPDIIITDIMMPEYDGLEMIRDIRNSELLNHIPVIIITAKSDDAYKLRGLDCGADACLIKPFSPDELKLRIRKLICYRSMLKEKYSQFLTDGKELAKEPDTPEQEKKFLVKLNSFISSKISLSNLNSEMLADHMCLSKSQLNRKVKSISGMNTTTYINQSRLAHAQVLLRDKERSIGDIVLMCGFESASYFAKQFKKKFGMTPSQYRKKNS